MKNPGLRYALYALIISILWTVFEHFMGYNTTHHETGQYTRMVGGFFYFIVIILAIAALRKQQGGNLSFAQGCKTGAITSVVYSICLAIWYAIYGEIINTSYKPTLIAFEKSKLEAANASPELVAEKIKAVDMQTGGSIASYLFLVVFMSIGGILVGTVASLILKRTRGKNN